MKRLTRALGTCMSRQQLQVLQQVLRDLAATQTETTDIAQTRKQFEEGRVDRPLAKGYTARPGTLGGVDVLHLDGQHDGAGVILYLHGGAYVIGSPRTHAALTARLAALAGANSISADYRLAPEHPFPAGLDDALAVYRALLDSGAEPARVAIAGDSAGGGLTMALLVAARDAGLPLPAAGVLFSPWTDLTMSGASVTGKADVELILSATALPGRAAHYAAGTALDHHLVSPLFADLTGLPPLLIQAGTHEILLDDSVRLAARAAAADVTVTLEVTAGAPHVFQAFAGQLDEADEALASAGTFIRRHL
jgi:epsilon-lactone hydrolase